MVMLSASSHWRTVAFAAELPLFVNVHPYEITRSDLLAEFQALRESGFSCPLTLEINEPLFLIRRQ